LQKAASIDPPNAGKYYYNLGALLVNSGKTDPAAAAFKKAIEADPNYAEAHYQYGLAQMAKAETTAGGKIVPPAGTKEEFEICLKLAPNGTNAAAAQAMIQTISSQIQTTYTNPDVPQAPAKKTKKK
jgi:tetratricopeptide (TPR) repeat protein